MDFVSLRELQRGNPKVWEALKKQKGRIVLVNKNQPMYLLVDLAGKNVVNVINMIDGIMNSESVTPAPS